MAASHPKIDGLADGSILPSWDTLKAVIEDHSITKKSRSSCSPKDQTQANYVCRQKDEGRPPRVYASLNSEGDIEIKKLSNKHLCAGAPGSTRTTANTQSLLQRVVLDLFYVSARTAPQDITDTVRKHPRVDASYQPAQECRSSLLVAASHVKLSSAAYLEMLHVANPSVYTHLEASLTQDPKVAYFHRVYLASAGTQQSRIWGRQEGRRRHVLRWVNTGRIMSR